MRFIIPFIKIIIDIDKNYNMTNENEEKEAIRGIIMIAIFAALGLFLMRMIS